MQIKEELQCRPIIYFHDDPDGLCSYLLLEKLTLENKPVPVKSASLNEVYAAKAFEWDKAVILDIPVVDATFVDAIKKPIIWIDHHKTEENAANKIFSNEPTTYACWKINPINWIGMIGCLGDWHMPSFTDQFVEEYPDLMKKGASVTEALYENEIGKLVQIFSFALKGDSTTIKRNVRILRKIKTPYEILKQETPEGKIIYKHYEHINHEYKALLKNALKAETTGKIVTFIYQEDQHSLTKDLANELYYRNPTKIIILGRERSGEIRCSLRSPPSIDLLKALQKALVGVQGTGGGHKNACGASIKKEDWERFIENLTATD